MRKEKEKKGYKYFWPIVGFSLILVISLWVYNFYYGYGLSFKQRGIFGDMFGAVNAIFSGLAFAGIIISLYLQRIDLKNQQKQLELNYVEIKQTNKEFKIQNDTLQIQKFENQYYKMIDLHKENVREINIPFFDIVEGSSSSQEYKQIETKTSNTILRGLQGKKAFVEMAKEITICLEQSLQVLNHSKEIYKLKDISYFAYSIFFWGVNSDFVSSTKISLQDCEAIRKRIKILQRDYKKNISSGKRQEVNTRYVPFQGHESRLGHYFRHLFQTVKYVCLQEEKGLLKYEDTRQYLRVLRAQLSNSEQLMLYYNYICGFGANWDRIGSKGYQFLTKYRMIHNIPINRVKVVVNPRIHFKDFICNHCSEKDELFEWGDKREELNCDGNP